MIQFLIWLGVWLGLFFLPRLLLLGIRWQNQAQFLATHPQKAWLISGYKLFLILWLPLSMVATARASHDAATETFYLLLAFVPLLGASFVKSIPEMALGIGWYYGFRLPETARIHAPFVNHSFRFLQTFDYHFALDARRVRVLGAVRFVVNTAVLLTLLMR